MQQIRIRAAVIRPPFRIPNTRMCVVSVGGIVKEGAKSKSTYLNLKTHGKTSEIADNLQVGQVVDVEARLRHRSDTNEVEIVAIRIDPVVGKFSLKSDRASQNLLVGATNEARIIGRLTRDPEALNGEGNGMTCTVAIHESYSKGAETKEITSFVRFVAFHSAAATLRGCKKGDLVTLDGRVQAYTKTADDGSKRTLISVMADSVAKRMQPARAAQAQTAAAQ